MKILDEILGFLKEVQPHSSALSIFYKDMHDLVDATEDQPNQAILPVLLLKLTHSSFVARNTGQSVRQALCSHVGIAENKSERMASYVKESGIPATSGSVSAQEVTEWRVSAHSAAIKYSLSKAINNSDTSLTDYKHSLTSTLKAYPSQSSEEHNAIVQQLLAYFLDEMLSNSQKTVLQESKLVHTITELSINADQCNTESLVSKFGNCIKVLRTDCQTCQSLLEGLTQYQQQVSPGSPTNDSRVNRIYSEHLTSLEAEHTRLKTALDTSNSNIEFLRQALEYLAQPHAADSDQPDYSGDMRLGSNDFNRLVDFTLKIYGICHRTNTVIYVAPKNGSNKIINPKIVTALCHQQTRVARKKTHAFHDIRRGSVLVQGAMVTGIDDDIRREICARLGASDSEEDQAMVDFLTHCAPQEFPLLVNDYVTSNNLHVGNHRVIGMVKIDTVLNYIKNLDGYSIECYVVYPFIYIGGAYYYLDQEGKLSQFKAPRTSDGDIPEEHDAYPDFFERIVNCSDKYGNMPVIQARAVIELNFNAECKLVTPRVISMTILSPVSMRLQPDHLNRVQTSQLSYDPGSARQQPRSSTPNYLSMQCFEFQQQSRGLPASSFYAYTEESVPGRITYEYVSEQSAGTIDDDPNGVFSPTAVVVSSYLQRRHPPACRMLRNTQGVIDDKINDSALDRGEKTRLIEFMEKNKNSDELRGLFERNLCDKLRGIDGPSAEGSRNTLESKWSFDKGKLTIRLSFKYFRLAGTYTTEFPNVKEILCFECIPERSGNRDFIYPKAIAHTLTVNDPGLHLRPEHKTSSMDTKVVSAPSCGQSMSPALMS